MIYIGYFLLFFVILRFSVSFINLRSKLYLYPAIHLDQYPKVSILIPARNEESNLKLLLSDISHLSYSNYEVLVYDDCSTDGTSKVVKYYISRNEAIQLIEGEELEQDWLGKNFACYNLASQATGNYLLFLDADVRIGANLIERALLTAQKQNLKLLSIFPQQIIDNKETWQVVPLMNWILLSLLPLILVRLSGWISFAAANGQFMLFETDTYRQLDPHKEFRASKVEDIDICRYYKKKKMCVATLLGDNDIRCKMYNNKDEAIEGFSKNIFAFFGNSIITTLLFALVTTLGPLFLFLVLSIEASLFYIAMVVLIRICVSVACKQTVANNIKYILLQHFVFLQIIYRALAHRKNKSLEWKGRKIDESK